MCAEIAQFPSLLMKGEEKEGIIITSESHTAPQQERETQTEITIEADHQTKIKPEDDDDDAIKSEEQNDDEEPTVSVSGDDDGFKTPTSSDHRIPPITQCPPAPKKPRPPPPKLKRKAPGSSRSIQLDESIFSTIAKDEDDAPPQKIKKARTDDSDRS